MRNLNQFNMKNTTYNALCITAFLTLFFCRTATSQNESPILQEDLKIIYENDSAFTEPDSNFTGYQKRFQRIEKLYGPRLFPSGDFNVGANGIKSYFNSFNEQANTQNSSSSALTCGSVTMNWTEEGPFEKAPYNGRPGNGQINRICFDPQFNLQDTNGQINQTIYAGSFHGGLWKTTDGGNTWNVAGTDNQLPQTSVSGIAVSYQNSNHIYISTGNGDALDFRHHLYAGLITGVATSVYSSGFYKSTDAGTTWNAMNGNLNAILPTYYSIRELRIDPNNPDVLYAPTSEGLLKCSNATSTSPTWQKLNTPASVSDNFNSFQFHPTDSNTIYAASDEILKSTDNGQTWTIISGTGTTLDFSTFNGNFQAQRIKLAVTPAAPDRIYANIYGREQAFNRSRKYIYYFDGSAWQNVSSDSSYISSSWMPIAVSPIESEQIFHGSIKFLRNNITQTNPYTYKVGYTTGVVHDDIHEIVFEPNDTTDPDFYVAHHGGISKTTTTSTLSSGAVVKNFVEITDGINTSMLWGLAISSIDEERILIGRQDNGTHESSNGGNSWNYLAPGDGYGAGYSHEALLNPPRKYGANNGSKNNGNNPVFFALPEDARRINGMSSSGIESWLPTDFKSKTHPVTNKKLFGFSELWSEYDYNGNAAYPHNNWKVHSDMYNITGTTSHGYDPYEWIGWRRIRDFEVAKSNSDYVYIVTFGADGVLFESNLKRSTTGLHDNQYHGTQSSLAQKFVDISSNLPQVTYQGNSYNVSITGIAVSKTNHLDVWIAVSGFHAGQKVYKSSDGGLSWNNADPNNCLPNLPCNAIVYQEGTDDRLYLAMDNGVYVSEGTGSSTNWKKVSDFPNVMTHQLVINECSNRIYAGTYGRGIWSAELLPRSKPYAFQEISSNTTWSENRVISGNIKVTSGSKLTISGATIFMPAWGEIHVEPNAILEIDSSTITNSCGNFWGGIKAFGDKTKDQLPLSQPLHQGKVYIHNNSVIENARHALANSDPNNYYPSAGGLIIAQNSTFKNNHRAAEFIAHTARDHSKFENCRFVTEPSFVSELTNNTSMAIPQITMWGTKGIEILGCTFENLSGYHIYNRYADKGIFTMDATYHIGQYCINPTNACTGSNKVPTVFRNYLYGVHAINSQSTHTTSIVNSEFYDNSIGFKTEVNANARFTDNLLQYGALAKSGYQDSTDLSYQYGVYSKKSTGYITEFNTFKKVGSAYAGAGILIEKSGTDPNRVFKNSFVDLDLGQRFWKRNRAGITGLTFPCNSNYNNTEDVKVDLDQNQISFFQFFDGIADIQVSPPTGAGNSWSSSATKHIENNTFPTIRYYDISSALPDVTKLSGPISLNSSNISWNNCNVIISRPELPPVHLPLENNAAQNYHSARSNYEQVLYTYHQLIDNGNTDSLITVIGLQFSADATALRDDLLAQSPYLSEEAIRSAAETGILSDGMLLEVCLANPEATMNEDFLNYLQYEIPNPLPQSMIELIIANWEADNPRTLLEGQIAQYAQLKMIWSNHLEHFYLTDSIDHFDSLDALFASKKNILGDYRRIELRMERGLFDDAYTIYEDIQNKYELQEFEELEYTNYGAYLSFRKELHNADGIYPTLNNNQKNTLRMIRDEETGRSSGFADNILCFFYQECKINVDEEGEYMERRRSRRQYSYMSGLKENKGITEISGEDFTIHPNPADDFIILSTDVDLKASSYQLRLRDMNGKLLVSKKLSNNRMKLEVAEFPAGLYIIEIFNEEENVFSEKFSVQ